MLDKIKEWWSSLNYYQRTLIIMLPICAALLAFLLIVNPGSLLSLVNTWFFDLIIIPNFINGILSGSTYVTRIRDIFVKKTSGKGEKAATIVGVSTGLVAGIVLPIVGATVPCTATLSIVANVIYTIRQMSAFGGLGHRIGITVDKDTRLPNERIIIGGSIILGFALGIVIALTIGAALVTIAGVTTFFTGGAALPLWVAGIFFVTTFASSMGSTADYVAKTGNLFKAIISTPVPGSPLAEKLKEKKHEYRGAAVGLIVGLAVAATIIIIIMATQPYLLVGLAGVAIGSMIFLSSIGLFGGFLSRLGRIGDRKARIAAENGSDQSNAKKLEKQPLLKPNVSQDMLFQPNSTQASPDLAERIHKQNIIENHTPPPPTSSPPSSQRASQPINTPPPNQFNKSSTNYSPRHFSPKSSNLTSVTFPNYYPSRNSPERKAM